MKIFTFLAAGAFVLVFFVGGLLAALITGVAIVACSAIAWDRGNDSAKAIGRRGGS